MNRVYKVVRSQATGQSTVTSELAKGKTKSTSRSIVKMTALISGVGMALSGTSAFAATCNTLANGTYSCTQSVANENLSYTATGDTSPVVLDARAIAGSEGTASIHLTDSHVVATGAHGVLARGKGASVVLDGNNSFTLGSLDDTAVLVMGNYGTGGNGSITVNGHLDININHAGVNNSDALESYGIDSTISHHGTGTITTNGGNGILNSATNNATVLIDGGAVFNISGNGNDAIRTSATSGNVKIDSNAVITTSGDTGRGIAAATGANSSGNIEIKNTGNIITSGLQATGIYAGTGTAGSGKITINNTGNITTSSGGTTTSGQGAHAITAVVTSPNGSSGGIEVNHTGGTLITSGYDSHGIRAITNASSGDVNITVTDAIFDVKGRNSDGIHVQRIATGNINSVSNINFNITTNGGEISSLDSVVAPSGQANYGIVAHQYEAAAGNINITNNGTKISTGIGQDGIAPQYSAAIDATFKSATATGNINVVNHGELSTKGSGAGSSAIYTSNSGSGRIDVTNSSNISVSGDDASAIKALSPSSGDIVIRHEAGAVITSVGTTSSAGGRTDAISGMKGVGSSGDITIYVDGDINTKGANRAAGAYALHNGVGNATVIGTGNIVADASNNSGTNIYSYGLAATLDSATAAGNATVGYSKGTIVTGGDDAYALYAGVVGKSGNTLVENSGTLETTGVRSYGIWARNVTTDSGSATNGLVNVLNSGNITTSGSQAHAIYANSSQNKVDVANGGNLNTSGDGAHGILAQSAATNTGIINVLNTGNITTNGLATLANSHGIYGIMGSASEMNIINDGLIHIKGKSSRGILASGATGSTITITNNGQIVHDDSGAHQYGIEVLGGNNTNKVVVNNGQVTGSNFGIVVWNNFNAHTGAKSTITIGSQGLVDAIYGLTADMSDENIFNIENGGAVNGKNTALLLRSQGSAPKDTVNNAGIITSGLDKILQSSYGSSSAILAINNQASGEMTGVMTTNAANTVLNNEGLWNIRQVADTDRDGTRETLSVAVSNFGTLGNNSVVNGGIIKLLGDAGEASTLINTSEYNTGFSANTMALGGSVQGHLLGVNSFTNTGEIDLTANLAVGDVLVITGSSSAGINGNGQFVSDGGSLKLDTFLNEGNANSQSDMLVIDNAITASGATKLYINQTGSGALTQGEGIKVIETLGTSSADSFALGKPVAAGLYEYVLNQGSSDQNWYLTSRYNQDLPIFNPATGAYLANQSAASGLFMHTLYDRQGHANNIAGGSAEKPSVWVRAATSHSRNQSINGMMGTKTDASLIHLGGDVGKWQNEEGNNLHLGLMGAYGQTDSDVVSQVTHTTANGKVTGYALGAYGTWFADEAQGKGLYIDGWAQYGWYKNKVSGQAQVNAEEQYDSTNWTASLEAGYGMLLHREDNTDLMFTPQVQITYNNYSADDHQDGNNLKVSGSDASGVITRVGARLHGKAVEGYGARPFMEANWIHNTAKNELNFNGEVLNDQLPEDKGELKLGLQGTIAKNWKVWGQVGGQWGSENYERYEGQIGVNYQW